MNTTTKIALTVFGIITGYCLGNTLTAEAHPCDTYDSNCHWVSAINPITGNVEQQYVCE